MAHLDPSNIFASFLKDLADALASKKVDIFESLFLDNGYLRDILICDWDFASIPKSGLNNFFKERSLPDIIPESITIDKKRSTVELNAATGWVQGFYVFETPIATGEGVIRLLKNSNDEYRALTLSFVLSALKNHEEFQGKRRPKGVQHGPARDQKNWLDKRIEEERFVTQDPQVVIVGAGHGGLMLGARLKRLGVRTLLIDKSERLGDTWRKRYHTLVLHDVVWGNHFPYLPFPDDWPVFIPKDKIANWFESYASIMELNVWLQSTVVPDSTSYDDATGIWNLKVQRGDGSIREIKCNHIVQATGHSGEPLIPRIPGIETFQGQVTHSSGHSGGAEWTGKKAIVVGSGNSGQDIAQDFYNCGADTTMVQRSSTLVVSSNVGITIYLAAYSEGGPPAEESDLASLSFPLVALEPYMKAIHAMVEEADKNMLQGLTKAGFKVEEKGSPGLFFKYFRRGGGYYIDVGSSSLIIDGKIKIKSGVPIERFEKDGLRFQDGSFTPADVVVLATGYDSMRETSRKIFGSKVADRTGPVWGVDSQGEIQGIWRYSGHPGFWYMGGNFLLARSYSKYLALQIKAIEEGLAPKVKK